jgi:SAM-dependent methyltransferase
VYFQELNPVRIQYLLTTQGYQTPDIQTACELGFGQGLSINAHASASRVSWYGNDFNPHHVKFAQDISNYTGNTAKLYEDSFKEFVQNPDLPKFDFICLHGIWSWISTENQSHIVEFLSRKLRPGGVVYVSYNTPHGHGAMTSIRELMLSVLTSGTAQENMADRVKHAIQVALDGVNNSPKFLKAHPEIPEKLQKMLTQDPDYIAHEYFNADWNLMSFTSLLEALSPAKLDFLSSYNFTDGIQNIHFSDEQQKVLNGNLSLGIKENMKDLIHNNTFRRDIFGKGVKKVSKNETIRLLGKFNLIVTKNLDEFDFKVKGTYAEAGLEKPFYETAINYFLLNGKASVRDVFEHFRDMLPDAKPESVIIILNVLVSKGYLSPCTLLEPGAENLVTARAFNDFVIQNSEVSKEVTNLVSVETGGAFSFTWLDILIINGLIIQKMDVKDSVNLIWDLLNRRGERLQEDGRELTEDEARKKLHDLVENFKTKHLLFLDKLLPSI